VRRFHENPNTWTYSISQRISHPSYTKRFADNDIALFKLSEQVQFNRYVIPICLPRSSDEHANRKFIATGWGRVGFGEDPSEVLMKVILDSADEQMCNKVYEDDGKMQEKQINWSKMICAGSTNKTGDTCAVSLIFTIYLKTF
jgi:prostasin